LIAHEFAHNLTWGSGHAPENTGGYSYVRFVGDEFALSHIDTLGVHEGYAAYFTEEARSQNRDWRSELTADAIASWMLGRIDGSYKAIVEHYIEEMLVCRLSVGQC
jgi:hypothetical protein